MTDSLSVALKLLIKDAICEALDEYTTRIKPAIEAAQNAEIEQPKTEDKKPSRRGRQPKTENASVADGAPEPQDEPKVEAKPQADPAVEYKKIQSAVMELIGLDGGRDKIVAILEQFGVSTALQLKPEQYGEALALLRQAIVEVPLA